MQGRIHIHRRNSKSRGDYTTWRESSTHSDRIFCSYINQYFVLFPLVSTIHLSRLGIVSLVFLIRSPSTQSSAFDTLCKKEFYGSYVIVVLSASSCNALLTLLNMFSMGFRSGDRGGILNKVAPMSFNASPATLLF